MKPPDDLPEDHRRIPGWVAGQPPNVILEAIRAAVVEERERCAKLADQSAAEAAERGQMIGGSPMHQREIMDRHIGEMVSKNIAAAIRARKL